MGVAADYGGDARGDRVEVKIVERVDQVEEVSGEFDYVGGRQRLG